MPMMVILVVIVYDIRLQQELPSWALYEIAEELTAAFSRLEPSMHPVLLIHYDTDVQNKTTKQTNIFTDNSSNKNSQNSKNSKNSKNKNNNYIKSKLKSY